MEKNKKLINQYDSKGRPHGSWEGFYVNGTLWRRGNYHHGNGHGVWEDYWENGKLWWRRHWHYGVMKGIGKMWNKKEVIIEKQYHLVVR